MITGREKPDAGEVVIGHTAQLAVVDQTRESLPNDKTAWEAISGGLDILTVGRFEMPSRAYLGRFNFKGGDQQKNVGQLSGRRARPAASRGDAAQGRQRAAAGRAVERPRRRDAARARRCAAEFAGSALVISHDRWFLDRIATHILAAEDDSKWVFFEGNFHEYEADKRKRLGEEGARPHRPALQAADALRSRRGHRKWSGPDDVTRAVIARRGRAEPEAAALAPLPRPGPAKEVAEPSTRGRGRVESGQQHTKEAGMIKWAIIFFIISVVAGFFGFTGVASGARTIAKLLFFIALVIFLIVLIFGVLLGTLVF